MDEDKQADGNKLQPRLRFRGFTDPWEQRQLGELVSERDKRSSVGTLISVSINGGVFPTALLQRKSNVSEDRSHYKVVKQGDIAYNSMRMWQGASGYSDYDGIMSPAYTVLIPRSGVDPHFLTQFFKTTKLLHIFQRHSQGLTSDTWNLKYPALSKISITTPSKQEQISISQFLSTLDSLIAAAERKHDLLKLKKQAYLQQMFPQKGENQPRLRFRGFTGDWEQRQLGEMGSFRSGYGFPEDQQHGHEGIPFFKVSDMNSVGNNQIMSKANNYVSDSQLQNNHWAPIQSPAIIFAKVGAALMLNRKRLVLEPFLLDNNMMAFSLKSNVDVAFYLQVFLNINLAKLAQYGALPSISAGDISVRSIYVPSSRQEQTLIGNLFQVLDSLIAAAERNVTTLKQLKQGYLQQMFV